MVNKAKQDIDETEIPVDEYTEAEREDAELICEALADNRAEFAHDDADAAIEAGISVGASAESVALALAASRAVPSMDKDTDEPLSAADIWGEAAAQIRELWSPGDSIGDESDGDAAGDEDEAADSGDPIGFADAPDTEPEPCAGADDNIEDARAEDAEDAAGGGGDVEDVLTEASDELADVPADFDHEHDRWAADGGRH